MRGEALERLLVQQRPDELAEEVEGDAAALLDALNNTHGVHGEAHLGRDQQRAPRSGGGGGGVADERAAKDEEEEEGASEGVVDARGFPHRAFFLTGQLGGSPEEGQAVFLGGAGESTSQGVGSTRAEDTGGEGRNARDGQARGDAAVRVEECRRASRGGVKVP